MSRCLFLHGGVAFSICVWLFALPGAKSFEYCKPAVFVIITLEPPILRQNFNYRQTIRHQGALAAVAHKQSGYIMIHAISQSKSGNSSIVTSRKANADAVTARQLVLFFTESTISTGWSQREFDGSSSISVQVTACPSGLALQPSQVC